MGFFQVSHTVRRRVLLHAELEQATAGHTPDAFDDLDTALHTLPDVSTLTAEQTVAALIAAQTHRNRIDALLTELAGHADTIGAATTLRAGSTGTLVAVATRQNPATGSAMVTTAHQLVDLPATADAFTAGHLSAGHVHLITRAAHTCPPVADGEAAITGLAVLVEPGETRRLLQLIDDAHTPQPPDLSTDQQQQRRRLHVSVRPNGMVRVDGLLPEIDGNRLIDILHTFTDPPTADDPRSLPQRRADAFTDLTAAAAANTHPLGVTGLSILVDATDLTTATTDNGTPIPAGLLDYHTCAAAISIIFGTYHKTRFVPLLLRRTTRRATAGQWAALIARDRGCIRCGRAPRFCHAHHIIHWTAGGPTDLPNLVVLCTRCHTDLHHGHYTITMTPHGIPEIHPTRAPPAAV